MTQIADALGTTRFDAVIDTSGEDPATAQIASDLLGEVSRYVFVSTLDVYRDWPPGPIRGEDDPVHEEESTDYGAAKAASERVLAARFGARFLAVRPGVIVGPGEVNGRLPAWLHRIERGGRVTVPQTLDQPICFVDVRDLSGWIVSCAERDLSGAVNATGPAGMTTYGGLLAACQASVAGTGAPAAELVPIPEADLLAAGVTPWRHLPFWVPADIAPTFWQVETGRARQWGLPTRPVEDTVSDTWAWLRATGSTGHEGRYGLPKDLEESLLASR